MNNTRLKGRFPKNIRVWLIEGEKVYRSPEQIARAVAASKSRARQQQIFTRRKEAWNHDISHGD